MKKMFLMTIIGLTLTLLVACSDGPPSNAAIVRVTANTEVSVWLEGLVDEFNGEEIKTPSGQVAHVEIRASDAGNAAIQISSGKAPTDLWIPDDEVWIDVLAKQGYADYGVDCTSVATSPLVIAMWRPVAEALGWPGRSIGWLDVGSLAADPSAWAYYSGGQFGPALRLGHTHPGLSASGVSTLLAIVQAAESKADSVTPQEIGQPIVQASVQAFEGAVAFFGTDTDELGRTMSERGVSYLGAAILYESTVMRYGDVDQDGLLDIVPVYPFEGTFVATHPACINQTSSTAVKEAAELFRTYMIQEEQQMVAFQNGLRPVHAQAAEAAAQAGTALNFAVPKEIFGIPSVESVYAIQNLWQSARKDVNLVMLLDTSASMRGNKIVGMRDAASQFVQQMGDDDYLSIVSFSKTPTVLVNYAEVGENRDLLSTRIRDLYVGGGTALYDAIGRGAQLIDSKSSPHRTNVLVVLTDGLDTGSVKYGLDAQLIDVAIANNTTVFTIAYGDDADESLLGDLANRGNGTFYQGGEADIAAIYDELSAAFGGAVGIGR